MLEHSNIPKKKWCPMKLTADDCDFDAFVRLADIKTDIVDFVNTGKNLYIYSPHTGNGKTSWSLKMLMNYFDKIWAGNGLKARGLFIYVPEFLARCKDFKTYDEQFENLKKLIPEVDLVVWDDIGSTMISNYDLSQMLMFIDRRILEEKSNIYTGNLGEAELKQVFGDRLASRVWKASEVVTLQGKDMRNYGSLSTSNNQ